MYEMSDWELRRYLTARTQGFLRQAEDDQFAQAYSKPGHSWSGRWLVALLAPGIVIVMIWRMLA